MNLLKESNPQAEKKNDNGNGVTAKVKGKRKVVREQLEQALVKPEKQKGERNKKPEQSDDAQAVVASEPKEPNENSQRRARDIYEPNYSDADYSSDLMTTQEERRLMADFWQTKQDLVAMLLKTFPVLRDFSPEAEPHAMADFIRDYWHLVTKEHTELNARHTHYHHLRHSISMANIRLGLHRSKKFRWSKLQFADLAQSAAVGLMEALDRFMIRKGTRFSTYGTWWVRRELQQALTTSQFAVTMTNANRGTMREISDFVGDFMIANEREPSNEEIGRHLHLSKETVDKLDTMLRHLEMDADQPGKFDKSSQSLLTDTGEMIGNGENSGGRDNSTLRKILQSDTRKAIDTAFQDYLRPREQKVLRMRFDLDDNSGPKTLRQIATLLRLSKERVRQIQNSALAKLRGHSVKKLLGGLLDG